MKPLRVELGLENCEVLVFDWKFVESISFRDTHTSHFINKDGKQRLNNWCKEFNLIVDGDGGEYLHDNGSKHWKERLVTGDVTLITIVYENDAELEYHVTWPDWSANYHPDQSTEMLCKGFWSIYCERS